MAGSSLPLSYLHSPYLSTDVEALKTQLDGPPVLNLNGDDNASDGELLEDLTQELPVKVCDICTS